MHLHRPFLLSLLLVSIPAVAHADDRIGIGPRTWESLHGVGLELRAGDYVAEVSAYGGFEEREQRQDGVPGNDVSRSRALAVKLGVLRDIAEVGPISLGVGIRVGLWRERGVSDYSTIEEHSEGSFDVLELPLRVRYEVGRHLSLHADFGVALRRTESTSYLGDEYGNRVDVSIYRTRSAQLFGGNLGSVGLTYSF